MEFQNKLQDIERDLYSHGYAQALLDTRLARDTPTQIYANRDVSRSQAAINELIRTEIKKARPIFLTTDDTDPIKYLGESLGLLEQS